MNMNIILTISVLLLSYFLMVNLSIGAVWLLYDLRKKQWKQRYYLYVFMAVFPAFIAVFIVSGLKINTTSSMPVGIYRAAPADSFSMGDLAEYCLDNPKYVQLAIERGYLGHGPCKTGLKPLVKAVGGLPGNVLSVDSQGSVLVDGKPLQFSNIREYDSRQRALPVSDLIFGKIPEGKIFLYSRHDGGFDSRYFGLVDVDKLKKVKPLLTFEVF